jgi:phosphoglycolate phosphatase
MSIETVLFDLDGTLIDSRVDLTSAVNAALESAGLPRKPEGDVVPHVGNGLRVLMAGVFGPVDPAVLEKGIKTFEAYYEAHCVDATTLYENVGSALAELSLSAKIGIVTNKPHHFAKKIIDQLGIGRSVGVVVGGDSFPEKKPHPRPLQEATRSLGGRIESTLMVGDGTQDIAAGKAAGIKTCAVRYGYGFSDEILKLKPDFVISRFTELKEIVL